MPLKKAGANWVDGDRFFNREVELKMLAGRARDGIHTLLTAPRRMGKTSLVRESLRRLSKDDEFETIFIDLEDASDPADAIAEIGAQSSSIKGIWDRLRSNFSSALKELGDRVDTIAVPQLQVQLRAGIAAGNQWRKGDEIFSALAECERPVIIGIDELPILVNRLLKRDGDAITQEGKQATDEFLSWLRKNAQKHRGRVIIILSGSVGLEPILKQAGLSAQVNTYTPLELKPWSEDIAVSCLAELAHAYDLDLSLDVRRHMCHLLRHHVPHHIQKFFSHMHDYLLRNDRIKASLSDVEEVYKNEMLSVRGQVDLEHYQVRLRMILGMKEYQTALELLTEASVSNGVLSDKAIDKYRKYLEVTAHTDDNPIVLEDILYLLEHDGYLERQKDYYEFKSELIKDWWRARFGQHFVSFQRRGI